MTQPPQGKAQAQQPQGKGQAQPQQAQGKAGASGGGQTQQQPQGQPPNMIALIGHMLQGGGGQPMQGGQPQQVANGTAPQGNLALQGGQPQQHMVASGVAPQGNLISQSGQVPGFPTWNPDAQGHMGGAGEVKNPNNGGAGIGSAQAPSTTQGGMGT